jgi:ATP-dependent helicase/nuclease subunit B
MALLAPQHIGWSSPLAQAVAEAILRGQKGSPVDLGSHRVIVPSSFASRLIQEELAKQAPNGVLLPVFQTPTEFLNFGDSISGAKVQIGLRPVERCKGEQIRGQVDKGTGGQGANQESQADTNSFTAAKSADALLAWIEIIQGRDRASLPFLFPNAKPGRFSFEEAKRLAQTLFELRDELGGSAEGLDFAGVAALPANPEKARWNDLASLEEGYRTRLNCRGLRDHNDLRSELARGEGLPEGVTHIWLAGLTDPQPLFITALSRLREHFEIQAIVGADGSEAENFDEWGRPRPESWQDRRSVWPDYAESVHVVGDAPESLKRLRALLGDAKPVDGIHAVCACDREVDAPKIAALIHSLGADAVNPLGVAHGSHGLHHALRTWSRCLGTEEPTFEVLREVLLIPELVRITTGGTTAPGFSELNEQLDIADRTMLRGSLSDLCGQIASLPKPENDARKLIEYEALQRLPARLEAVLALRRAHLSLTWQEALVATISLLTADKKLREDDPEGAFAIEVAERLIATAQEIDAAQLAGDFALTHEQLFGLTLDAASTQRHRFSDAQEAVNLPGWVEAPWDPVPHLILFGLNDHLIPRVVHAHPYLPAQLRGMAGLATNAAAFASAAFTFEQLWRRRQGHGWLDVVVPQQDADGNPLRPSRLLFQAPDDALTRRVAHLFADAPNSEAQPYWEIPAEHKFVPLADPKGAARVVKSISATAFKVYLADPADFWLKRALGMDEAKHGSLELDAAGFGTLAHGALELFGHHNLETSVTSTAEVHRQLMDFLDEYVRATFGSDPSTAIRFQVESARGRLAAFAQTQAKIAAEGWVIKAVEGTLPEQDILGVKVTGKFDRLDHNTRTGHWRVYDYKTFNYAKNPIGTHTAKAVEGEPFTSAVRKRKKNGDDSGETKLIRWKDLQLPVYHMALKQGWEGIEADATLHLGYLCLPAQVSDTGEEVWEHYHADHLEAAEEQIKAVIAALKRGGSESYQPSERGSDYPVLDALKGRQMKDYLNLDQMGGTRA